MKLMEVVPTGNVAGALLAMPEMAQLSVAVAFVNVIAFEQRPKSALAVTLAGDPVETWTSFNIVVLKFVSETETV